MVGSRIEPEQSNEVEGGNGCGNGNVKFWRTGNYSDKIQNDFYALCRYVDLLSCRARTKTTSTWRPDGSDGPVVNLRIRYEVLATFKAAKKITKGYHELIMRLNVVVL